MSSVHCKSLGFFWMLGGNLVLHRDLLPISDGETLPVYQDFELYQFQFIKEFFPTTQHFFLLIPQANSALSGAHTILLKLPFPVYLPDCLTSVDELLQVIIAGSKLPDMFQSVFVTCVLNISSSFSLPEENIQHNDKVFM